MKYDQKFEELLIVFIITSITYFGIKIFFQFMKVTKVKKKYLLTHIKSTIIKKYES